MNQFNALNGDEPTYLPRYCIRKPPSVHFKSQTSPTQTIPVVLDIMVRLKHHIVYKGDVGVNPSEYPF